MPCQLSSRVRDSVIVSTNCSSFVIFLLQIFVTACTLLSKSSYCFHLVIVLQIIFVLIFILFFSLFLEIILFLFQFFVSDIKLTARQEER